jgi:hypothetical protein
LIKAAAAVLVGTAFHRQAGDIILWISAFNFLAGRTAVMIYDNENVFHAWIFLVALARYGGLRILA